MSEERFFGNQENQDAWMDRSFQEWDAGEPSDIWPDLDESLSLDAVWNRVDVSLTETAADEWLRESHDEWSPVMENDQWNHLNDSLSLENVWTGLNQSLNQPVTTRIPYWKLIAASFVAVFFTHYFSDSPVPHESYGSLTQSSDVQSKNGNTPVADKTAGSNGNTTGSFGQSGISGDDDELVVNNEFNELPVQNQVIAPDEPVQKPEHQREHPVEQITGNPETNESNTTDVTEEIDPLEIRKWKAPEEFLTPRDFIVARPYHHWTVQMGTQLSVLKERDQAAFTSTVPRFGMAADLSYRHRVGPVQLIHAIGMSQYEQVAGKYINGRYSNTDQQINALQLSSSVAYTSGKFTFYGGLLFSKMLTGLEQNNYTITKVYNFNRLQTGFTGGIDYRLVSFPNSGKHISIGAQYQLLPSYKGEKTTFENIHGIRFQAKFSF